MNSQAVIFLYEGEHPNTEAIRAMAEALLKSDITIDVQTLSSTCLNETEIAQAMLAFAIKSEDIKAVDNVIDINALHDSIDTILRKFHMIAKKDATGATCAIISQYIVNCLENTDPGFIKAVQTICAINNKKLFIQYVSSKWQLSKQTAEILYSAILQMHKSVCQGRIVG